MEIKELFKSSIILVFGMLYHSYFSSMIKEYEERLKQSNQIKQVVVKSPQTITKPTEFKRIRQVKTILTNITATMYYPVVSQCDNDPLVTAGMFKINPTKASEHKWIAMSRNLLKRWGGKFNFGDLVSIRNAGKKSGVYKVTDTMNERYVNRIDILETEGTPKYKFNNIVICKL